MEGIYMRGLVLVFLAVGGCVLDYDLKVVDEETDELEPSSVLCPNEWSALGVMLWSEDDIIACYGDLPSDSDLYCSGNGFCEEPFSFTTAPYEITCTQVCWDRNEYPTPPESCCTGSWVLNEPQPWSWADAVGVAVLADSAVVAQCPQLLPDQINLVSPDPPDMVVGEYTGSCPFDSDMGDSSSDYQMDVDPSLSYLLVSTSTDSLFSPLTGGGLASTGPAEFASAVAFAQDGALDGDFYSDWRLWFNSPISPTVASGNYIFQPSAVDAIYGNGVVNGVDMHLIMRTGVATSGTIDTVGQTWALDYHQTSGADSITVHLEGSIAPN